MEPARGSRRLRSWSLLCLLLAASHSWSGAQGQETFQVWQTKDPVSVAKGETVVLNCTVSREGPAGPVKWFKEKGSERKEIYNFKGSSYDRIKPLSSPNTSNVDFSISISNITPEDTGTYYCVKFQKGTPDIELKSGGGTKLSVSAKPSTPLVSGPQERINVKKMGNFTCNSTGFSPKDITLKWFKNGNEVFNVRTNILPEGDSVSYNISSILQVNLEPEDVHSQIICEVMHKTLQSPLRGEKNLSNVIRVLPEVDIFYRPAMNHTNITCSVTKFYPNATNVTLLQNGSNIETTKTYETTTNKDGTYNLNISFLVNTSMYKEAWNVTCSVRHDSQPAITTSKIVRLPDSPESTNVKESAPASQNIFIAVGIVCIVLAALLIATIYLIRAKQKKAKGSTSSTRLHEPEKNARDLSQMQDTNDINNDITYADLNLPRGKKSTPRAVETNNQTEYASIQTGPSPQREDNLTYADLDMVHLNRSSKKTATRPEESYSEYASVQVQRK